MDACLINLFVFGMKISLDGRYFELEYFSNRDSLSNSPFLFLNFLIFRGCRAVVARCCEPLLWSGGEETAFDEMHHHIDHRHGRDRQKPKTARPFTLTTRQ